MSEQDDGGLARPPKIYDVVPLPDSERGRECTLWTGEGPTPCGNEATYLFVYEVSLDPSSDKRGNCLCCAECKPRISAPKSEPRTDGGQGHGTVRCPNGHIGRVDADQLNGDVSIICDSCSFHGYVDDCTVLSTTDLTDPGVANER